MNIRDTVQGELQKNQSLQNINRRYKVKTTADSDEDVTYRRTSFQYKRHEPNGNYQDSDDEDMDVSPPVYVNTVRMENGVDSSDHDANDNPLYPTAIKKTDKLTDTDLPNLDSITLKSKPKSGKVRKMKRRTVKWFFLAFQFVHRLRQMVASAHHTDYVWTFLYSVTGVNICAFIRTNVIPGTLWSLTVIKRYFSKALYLNLRPPRPANGRVLVFLVQF